MKTGKAPENILKRSVLDRIKVKNGEVWSGAGIGHDCAIFPSAAEGAMAYCTQEAVLATPGGEGTDEDAFMTMAGLVQKCANNLAAGGARPVGAMITLFLPEETQEDILRQLMAEGAEKCGELSMEIVGGQTRISASVNAPVAVVTGIGITDSTRREKAAPGQDVVVSKWIGLQGTAVLAKRHEAGLLQRYPEYLVRRAQEFDRYLSILPEAEAACRAGVCAMHDASEGGIFGALWELAQGAGVGLRIDLRKLPLRQETVEVCECCNVNPYELMSGGCLVMTAQDGPGLAAALEAEGIPAAVVGKVTADNGRILVNGEEIRYMNRPERDGVYENDTLQCFR